MKNITLKSLLFDLVLITFVCSGFIVLGIVNVFNEFIPKGCVYAILGFIAWIIFAVPIILRYLYVKRLCMNSEIIVSNIISKNSDSLMHNGYYYEVQINDTNSIFSTSTKFRVRKEFFIGDTVKICYDKKIMKL